MLRVVFMGTPDFAVPTLSALLAAGHDVVAVYTQPPRPAGRGMAERPSPVHLRASDGGIPVRTPKSLRNEDAARDFESLSADVAVVVAYGLILPRPILVAPRLGCFNLHASELPRWRGAAPIQRAIMAGDERTAASIMRMEEGLDTGPVCLSEAVTMSPSMTAGELHDFLSERGARLMVEAMSQLEAGNLTCKPQSEQGITYAAKIDKAEARIDFTQPASSVHNLIRGLSPFPGAWFEVEIAGRRERIKILRSELTEGEGKAGTLLDDGLAIACGSGAIRVLEAQRAGKRPMLAEELLRGLTLAAGTHVTS